MNQLLALRRFPSQPSTRETLTDGPLIDRIRIVFFLHVETGSRSGRPFGIRCSFLVYQDARFLHSPVLGDRPFRFWADRRFVEFTGALYMVRRLVPINSRATRCDLFASLPCCGGGATMVRTGGGRQPPPPALLPGSRTAGVRARSVLHSRLAVSPN